MGRVGSPSPQEGPSPQPLRFAAVGCLVGAIVTALGHHFTLKERPLLLDPVRGPPRASAGGYYGGSESEVPTRLRRALAAYRRRHAAIVSGADRDGGYVVYECTPKIPPAGCGGWGDRIKGMMNAFVLALLLDRAFLVNHTKGGTLSPYYDSSEGIRWDAPTPPDSEVHPWRLAHCINSGCKCLREKVEKALEGPRAGASVIKVRQNFLCVRELIHYPAFRARARELGLMDGTEVWRVLWEFAFRPSGALHNALEPLTGKLHSGGAWYTAVHFRFGDAAMTTHLDKRPRKQNATDVKGYLTCMQSLRQGYYKGVPMNYFIAADNIAVQKEMVESTNKQLRGKGVVITTDQLGKKLGKVCHIDRDPEEGQRSGCLLRLLLDFELMRRADAIIPGFSGLSHMAATLGRMELVHDRAHCSDPYTVDGQARA